MDDQISELRGSAFCTARPILPQSPLPFALLTALVLLFSCPLHRPLRCRFFRPTECIRGLGRLFWRTNQPSCWMASPEHIVQ
ncbi:hypothetical protein L211DRAFT_229427 [Terfezia boudieri ATCC MYA-4762]|uniref:Uncharacterized protein n=1 Tax=Terfezia boudieri ATCC MYA-4762 TaxID=1051890 RepID=A0A3N4LM74_9PEZI|nr:hypothetical protein L211DRAFT_229427 [Terfezia boudieri ATCC MYA-4762]